MKRLFLVCIFIILIFSFKATNAFAQIASGLHNPVFGAKALSQGNAFAARADDPSAIEFNPAGLTQLERPQTSSGAAFLYPTVEYHGPSGDEDMDTTINTIPNLYFATPIIKDKLAAGLGVTVPYGLQGKWNEDGFSRFVVTKFDLTIINVNPTITYKPLSFLSIGAGLDYYYADSTQERHISPLIPGEGFSGLEMHGDAFGYNVGILCNITSSHSVGISFRSKADIGLEGHLKQSGLPASLFGSDHFSSRASTTATIPEMLTFGYAYRRGNLWSIEADVQWTNWSRFDVLGISLDPPNPLLGDEFDDVRKWHDTWGFALGGEYKLNEAIKVRGGYTFHETPVPSETFDPSVPQASRHALFTGFGYAFGKKLNKWVDFAYGVVFYEDRKVDNSIGKTLATPNGINGHYDLLTQILAINFNYRF